MKRTSVWVMGIIVVAILIVVTLTMIVINNQQSAAPEKTDAAAASNVVYSPPTACDILTLDTARKVDNGLTANDGPTSEASTDAIVVSNCSYYDAATQTSVGLLVRGAKNNDGATSNTHQFATLPAGAQAVSGYGDNAYWDALFGQFNILKHHNWYIVSNGPIMPKDRTLNDAKKLADIIIDKL